MTPEERYEALAVADRPDLEELADAILATGVPVEVTAGPEVVTAPVRLGVPGTRSTSTVVGQVGLTTCTVEVVGVRGDGCRAGHDLSGAVAAALCDAEVGRGGPLADAVLDLASRALARRSALWAERARRVELTRVEASA